MRGRHSSASCAHQCDRWASTLLFVSHDRQLAVNFDREVNLPAINRVVPEGSAA